MMEYKSQKMESKEGQKKGRKTAVESEQKESGKQGEGKQQL